VGLLSTHAGPNVWCEHDSRLKLSGVDGIHYAAELRREICARNAEFALTNRLDHVPSYGAVPVTVYAPDPEGTRHGNFFPASYRAILKRAEWSSRLNKVHAQARTALPRADRRWRELDSCTSSDALLMNIFCCPGVCNSKAVTAMLGTEPDDVPEFGYRARVPMKSAPNGKVRFDRTEVDMKLGTLLVEAKLTENDFQNAPAELVASYRDLEEVFEISTLPRSGDRYVSYQLVRNVLAAHTGGLSFCVMLDARRPDLLEAWHAIMRAVTLVDLRTRCKVLTWQELSNELPRGLREFLRLKYGIISPALP
jgi:Restriction Endonuclease associating with ARP